MDENRTRGRIDGARGSSPSGADLERTPGKRKTCTRVLSNARLARQLNAQQLSEGAAVDATSDQPHGQSQHTQIGDVGGGRGGAEKAGPPLHVPAPNSSPAWRRVHRAKLPFHGFKTRGELIAARAGVHVPQSALGTGAPAADEDNSQGPVPTVPRGPHAASRPAARSGSPSMQRHPGAPAHPASSPMLIRRPRSLFPSGLGGIGGGGEGGTAGEGLVKEPKAGPRLSRRRLLDPEPETEGETQGDVSKEGTGTGQQEQVRVRLGMFGAQQEGELAPGGGTSQWRGRRRLLDDFLSEGAEAADVAKHVPTGAVTEDPGMAREGVADGGGEEDVGIEGEGEEELWEDEEEEAEEEEEEDDADRLHDLALEEDMGTEARPHTTVSATQHSSVGVDARVAMAQSLGIPVHSDGSPIVTRDSLQQSPEMPSEFQALESCYGAVEVACKLLRTRRHMNTLHHIAPVVEGITRRRFLEKHVAQMLWVAPSIVSVDLVLRPEANSSPVKSNTRVSRFGTTKWDLKISLLDPPPGSTVAASGTPQAAPRTHATPGARELKRRRLFNESQEDEECAVGGSADVGVELAQHMQGVRRLSEAEAMVWRKREFRRRLQELQARRPALAHIPEAPLPDPPQSSVAPPRSQEPRQTSSAAGPSSAAAPKASPAGQVFRADVDQHSPVPPRSPFMPGRQLFASFAGPASRQGADDREEGEEGEEDPEEAEERGGVRDGAGAAEPVIGPIRLNPYLVSPLRLDGSHTPQSLVTPPASPPHRVVPPGSIPRGPGPEPARVSLTPVFLRYPLDGKSTPDTLDSSAVPAASQAPPGRVSPGGVMLHPLLRADAGEVVGADDLIPTNRGAPVSAASGRVGLHPLLRASATHDTADTQGRGAEGQGYPSPDQGGLAPSEEQRKSVETVHLASAERATEAAAGERDPTGGEVSSGQRRGNGGEEKGREQDIALGGVGGLDADSADILKSLPPDLLHAVQRREQWKVKDSSEVELRRRKREQVVAELPMVVDAIATVFASNRTSVLPHRQLVGKVASSRVKKTNQFEIEEQLTVLLELVPDWLVKKSSSQGEELYKVNKTMALGTVKAAIGKERQKLRAARSSS